MGSCPKKSFSTNASGRVAEPLHYQPFFEDLELHRFEDLIRQLAYSRNWSYLDATGRLGADGGLDIRGLELTGRGRILR
jgi:hypothetical protein